MALNLVYYDNMSIFSYLSLEHLSQFQTILPLSSDDTSLKPIIASQTSPTMDLKTFYDESNIDSTEATLKAIDESVSSMQSTLISHNQTLTIEMETNSSTIKSFTEFLNITSALS